MGKIASVALAAAFIGFAGSANAQQPAAPAAPPQRDFSKVEIKTTDLGNKTYMLEGQGGNITIAVGTDGIIMVDGQFAPLHDKIKAAIEAISTAADQISRQHALPRRSYRRQRGPSTRTAPSSSPTSMCATASPPAPPTA